MDGADTCRPTVSERLLLKAALFPGLLAEEAWRDWRSQVDLDRLDHASAALLPLVSWNLAHQGVDVADAAYLRWWHHALWAANARRQASLEALLTRLAAAGIETMLLKGAALIVTDYADLGLRAMGDVDVLVRQDHALAAMRCLHADGWRPVGRTPFSNAPELTVPVRHAHEFARSSGERVDLHWHVLGAAFGNGADDLFWADAQPARFGGIDIQVPSPVHRLLHACVHGVRWTRPRHIRWIADAITILSRAPAMDWNRLVETAQAGAVAGPLHDALALLKRGFDVAVPADALAALRATPATRVERLRDRLETRRRGFLGALILLLCRQWCLARRPGRGMPLIGLPGYLRRLYEIENIWQVHRIVAHGVRSRPAAH